MPVWLALPPSDCRRQAVTASEHARSVPGGVNALPGTRPTQMGCFPLQSMPKQHCILACGTLTCAWMTKPSLAMRPTGLMEHRVLARDSGPSVTLEMVYSASSTCIADLLYVR